MATKYGIFGAAFNGDGTVSTEAGSDGAAGAWKIDQTAGNILTGTAPTYGALAAGDTVHIRSKTGNGANANISNTLAAAITLGNANATSALPITWILDDGTVWSGQNGTLKYETSTVSSYSVSTRQYNVYIASTPLNWILEWSNVSPFGGTVLTNHEDARMSGFLVNLGNKTSSSACTTSLNGLFENGKIRWGRVSGGATVGFGGYSAVMLLNTDIELTYATPAAGTGVFATPGVGTPGSVTMIGGRIYGVGATSPQELVTAGIATTNGAVTLIGVDYPKTMSIATQQYRTARINAFGMDGGLGGVIVEPWGTADSRTDGFYPTLNATLPNSASTPWSWRVYPAWTLRSTPSRHMRLTASKLYQATAAAKTVTLEVLIADTMTYDKGSLWMDVSYVDNSTGNRVVSSTLVVSGGSLDTSTASWSAATWGAVNLLKRKLALTTPTSIKQDTMVICTLRGTVTSASSNDILFACPDPQLT